MRGTREGKRENMVQKLQESGPVLFNRQIAEGIYHMSVLAPHIAAAARPGQFVQVNAPRGLTPDAIQRA